MIETEIWDSSLQLPLFFCRAEVGRGHVPRITVSANSYSSAATAHCKKAVCAGVRGGKAFEDDDGMFDKDVAMEDEILLLLETAAVIVGILPEFDEELAATRLAKTGRIPLDEIADRSGHNTAAAATASSVSSRSFAFRLEFSCCSLEIAAAAISEAAANVLAIIPIACDWRGSSRSCVAAAQRYNWATWEAGWTGALCSLALLDSRPASSALRNQFDSGPASKDIPSGEGLGREAIDVKYPAGSDTKAGGKTIELVLTLFSADGEEIFIADEEESSVESIVEEEFEISSDDNFLSRIESCNVINQRRDSLLCRSDRKQSTNYFPIGVIVER